MSDQRMLAVENKTPSTNRRSIGLGVKAPLLIGSLVLATAMAIGTLTYIPINDNLVKRELADLGHDARIMATELQSEIRQLRTNTALLARVPPVQGLIRAIRTEDHTDVIGNSTQTQWEQRLQSIFKNMLAGKSSYRQARFIGINNGGMELVRVDRVGDRIDVIPPEKLQHKGNTDYFRHAIQLNAGEIYLSEINLNREHGAIEIPHRPMIRAATPIFDAGGELFGIIIINAQISNWFDRLQAQVERSRTLYITNDKGDFLWHPDPQRRFAFETGTPYTLAQEFGQDQQLFNTVTNVAKANILNDHNGEKMGLGNYQLAFDPENPSRYLGITVTAPYDLITAENRQTRNTTLVAGLALAFLMITIAYFFTRKLLIRIGGEPEEIELVARRITQGDLDVELRNSDSATGIWAEVCKMVYALRENRTRTEAQNWLKSELSRILSLSQQAQTIEELSNNVLSEITPLVGAGCSAFYVCTTTDSGELTEDLGLFATYGLEQRKRISNRIAPGEGLVGQCALEAKAIVLTQVPSDYITINSGIGEQPPLMILVLPILVDEDVVAVMEFGTFQAFSDIQRELLNQVCANIGIAITSIAGQIRTQSLLEESQALGEELQVTNEELEEKSERLSQQADELQATNEELEEKSEALQIQKQAVEQKNQEIEQAREDLEQRAEQLSMASRYKSEFLANMSHELRTPLNSLLILAKSLADNKTGNLTHEQVEFAQIIRRGGEDLLSLINDILDLSKVEAGRMDVNLEPIDLRLFLDRLKKQFQPVANDKGLEFILDIDAATPKTLSSDPQRLEQILRNLLSNALKFTEQGRVSLSVTPNSERNQLSITVADTGIGIPDGKRQAIFEAFQQADGSTSRVYGGTGLGLAISRELSALLGGSITVNSEPGKGSVFTLLLPADLVDSTSATVSPSSSETVTKRTAPISTKATSPEPDTKSILIIEDDLDFANVVATQAKKRGYHCLISDNAREGLELAQQCLPGGIILDLGLPDIDGIAVLDHLKDNLATRHIPVHVISARDEKKAVLLRGALGFLEKPVRDVSELEHVFDGIEAITKTSVKRVLLVDDDNDTCNVVRELLADMDIEFVTTNDGKSALVKLRHDHFDCLILDLHLPDISGFEVLKQASTEDALTIPPVIIYTASELSREAYRELQQYTDSIVVKGVHSSERLLDEVSLFLHSMQSSLPTVQKRIMEELHEKDNLLNGKRILLVDDDVKNSFALSKILYEQGMKVDVADNGAMALDCLNGEATYDMVLMDIMMPVMDGLEAMRKIRENPKLSALPIIALTAKAMREDMETCLKAGANDYLTKPLDVDKLLSLIRVWLFNANYQDRYARS